MTNIEKSTVLLYTSKEHVDTEIKDTNLFIIVKNKKCFSVNIIKHTG